jgi:hypothetical protein
VCGPPYIVISEKLTELIRGHTDDGQDVPQCAPRHVLTRVDRDRNATPIRVLHHVMAPVDPLDAEASALKRLDYVRSRYDRDGTRHKSGSYQKSGHVECHGQLTRWTDHFEQCLKRGAQIGDRLVWRRSIADCADARPDEGRSAPDAVLVLLDGVGHVDVMSHLTIMHKLCPHMPAKIPAGRLGTSRVAATPRHRSPAAHWQSSTRSQGRSWSRYVGDSASSS